MLKLGLHVSISGTIDKAVDRAVERGCNIFQIFTKNPRRWHSKKLTPAETEAFIDKASQHGISPIFGHMPYLSNLASPKGDVYRKTVKSLISELRKCEELRIPYLVAHLGSHLGAGKEVGFRRITGAIDTSFPKARGDVMLLLENTAGTKNSMGGSFQDISYIIERLGEPSRVGVCFDTSHAFAAGYDLRTRETVEATLSRFDEALGLERMKMVHLNDSLGGLGSRIDRHEHIGMGKIGEDGFRNILESTFGRLPLILETPIDNRRSDIENLRKVEELAGKAR